MGGGSRTVAKQTPQFPPEVANFLSRAFGGATGALDISPLSEFAKPSPETIVGPDPATLRALDFFNSIAGGGATPGVIDAFTKLQEPLIEQSAMQAGLG